MTRIRRSCPLPPCLRFAQRKLKWSAPFGRCRSSRRRWPYRLLTCSAAHRSASRNLCIHTRKSAYHPRLKCIDWILSPIGMSVNAHGCGCTPMDRERTQFPLFVEEHGDQDSCGMPSAKPAGLARSCVLRVYGLRRISKRSKSRATIVFGKMLLASSSTSRSR